MERVKMPRIKRAAQFAPFEALKGMREALAMVEYEHERKEKGEVMEDVAEKISAIMNELDDDTIVKAKYFDDGYNKTYVGKVKLHILERKINLVQENKDIDLDNLLDLDV